MSPNAARAVSFRSSLFQLHPPSTFQSEVSSVRARQTPLHEQEKQEKKKKKKKKPTLHKQRSYKRRCALPDTQCIIQAGVNSLAPHAEVVAVDKLMANAHARPHHRKQKARSVVTISPALYDEPASVRIFITRTRTFSPRISGIVYLSATRF